MERPIMLMVVVLILSIYLGLTWLAVLIGIGAFFMVLSTVEFKKPMPVAQAAAAPKEEEILTPVVVQDVGDPPFLYPENFGLKVKPNWKSRNFYEGASAGLSGMFRSLFYMQQGHRFAKQNRGPPR